MFKHVYSSGGYSLCLFSGTPPTKEEAQNTFNSKNIANLDAFVDALGYDTSPKSDAFLCELGFREQNPRLAGNADAFPKLRIKLNKTSDPSFYFRNEGQADWFIFTCHQSLSRPVSTTPVNLIAIGAIGDLGSSSDIEMNQRLITSDMNVSASNLNLNFDRLFRMDV